MSILIKNVILNGKKTDIYIERNVIESIGKPHTAEFVIEADGKAAIPGFVNTHTHAAMSLFRGYADDMQLKPWLEEKIWPLEKKLRGEDVYWGTRLACIEMIRSGVSSFNDMYYFWEHINKAVEDSGMRAFLGPVFIDLMDEEKAESERRREEDFIRASGKFGSRVKPILNLHSVYTVSQSSLEWCRDMAEENELPVHVHVSETLEENANCIRDNGSTPAAYLDDLGLLGPNTIAVHCVHLTDSDISTLAKRGVSVSHNPISNMKLSAGGVMPLEKLSAAGVNVSLGTDGCASNNNLDMFSTMKAAAIVQKNMGQPTDAPAQKIFNAATAGGASALGINAGRIEEGMLADIVLLNLTDVRMVPNHNLISNIVYSATPSCVDTVICDGKILMQSGKIPGEAKILKKAAEIAEDLIER